MELSIEIPELNTDVEILGLAGETIRFLRMEIPNVKQYYKYNITIKTPGGILDSMVLMCEKEKAAHMGICYFTQIENNVSIIINSITLTLNCMDNANLVNPAVIYFEVLQ